MLGLLHRLVALAELPSRLLSMGEMGRVVDAAVPRRGNAMDGAEAGGESSEVSVFGTATRETFLKACIAPLDGC